MCASPAAASGRGLPSSLASTRSIKPPFTWMRAGLITSLSWSCNKTRRELIVSATSRVYSVDGLASALHRRAQSDAEKNMSLPELVAVTKDSSPLHDPRFDAVVLVTSELPTGLGPIASAVARASALDQRVGREITLLPAPDLAGGRLVLAPTGPLDRD